MIRTSTGTTKASNAQKLVDWKRRKIESLLYGIGFELNVLMLEATDAKEAELVAALETIINWKAS